MAPVRWGMSVEEVKEQENAKMRSDFDGVSMRYFYTPSLSGREYRVEYLFTGGQLAGAILSTDGPVRTPGGLTAALIMHLTPGVLSVI